LCPFYNDSASTNPSTTAAAIKSFKDPLILIMGGKDKQVSFDPLIETIKSAENLKMVILFGENKDQILAALNEVRINNPELKILEVGNLQDAVRMAYAEARKYLNTEIFKYLNILLSPASSSFDMFKDYADRGNKFKNCVSRITKK
jgi:UDP-N-acetylmuramoylalanine--D-glutamate ligase